MERYLTKVDRYTKNDIAIHSDIEFSKRQAAMRQQQGDSYFVRMERRKAEKDKTWIHTLIHVVVKLDQY